MTIQGSAELVAPTLWTCRYRTMTYASAPPSWSRVPAELVALNSLLPPSWSRFSAELVAPYIEQNTSEHFSRTLFRTFRTAAFLKLLFLKPAAVRAERPLNCFRFEDEGHII